MARTPRTEETEVAAVEPTEAVEVAEETEVAAEQPEVAKLRFVVKSNRIFGYQVGDVVEFAADEVRPEWLQHLEPAE